MRISDWSSDVCSSDLASHTHVHRQAAGAPARFISQALATAIASGGGGVIGAWPAGIGIDDLNGFVDRTLELIDRVGIDHVCLGTDMDANYKPEIGRASCRERVCQYV